MEVLGGNGEENLGEASGPLIFLDHAVSEAFRAISVSLGIKGVGAFPAVSVHH